MTRKYKQPDFVCWECVEWSGKVQFASLFARYGTSYGVEGICDICKRKAILIPAQLIGHFTPGELIRVQDYITKHKIKGSDRLDPKKVAKALLVVDGVLGQDGMSKRTKGLFVMLSVTLDKGGSVRRYDLEKLMYFFGLDVEVREANKKKYEAGSNDSGLCSDTRRDDHGRSGDPVDGGEQGGATP